MWAVATCATSDVLPNRRNTQRVRQRMQSTWRTWRRPWNTSKTRPTLATVRPTHHMPSHGSAHLQSASGMFPGVSPFSHLRAQAVNCRPCLRFRSCELRRPSLSAPSLPLVARRRTAAVTGSRLALIESEEVVGRTERKKRRDALGVIGGNAVPVGWRGRGRAPRLQTMLGCL